MSKLKTFKGAALVAATSMLPISQAAMAEYSLSGWVNEGVTFYDTGDSSDMVQMSDNGTTLGTRMTFAADTEVATGINAGFEIILEPQSSANVLGWGSTGGLMDDSNGHSIGVLGNSVHIGGAWGKLTVGLQSMPTDNIAVLEDPSLTLWASISPVFKGNSVTIDGLGAGATNSTWGDFLKCLTVEGLFIGIDCNGIYRSGIRYDLPAFGPVTIAIGHANDDVYDIAAKYKGDLGSLKASVALGYAVNNGADPALGFTDAENFQIQGGLMHPATGLYGSIAYQHEEADQVAAAGTVTGDDTDAWWLKVGIKKQWFSLGDTSLGFQYGQYSDQFGTATTATTAAYLGSGGVGMAAVAGAANPGITGSEVERIGLEVNQYFGSSLIVYGVWEQLDLDVDCMAASACIGAYAGAEELDTFTLGATYFF